MITERGRQPNTMRRELDRLVQTSDLIAHPNYVGVDPGSYNPMRKNLGDANLDIGVPELKKRANYQSVKDAFECYGYNPHHRFGMSDDDPENLKLILEAFQELKKEFPENAFFAFNTFGRKLSQLEVTESGQVNEAHMSAQQEQLFNGDRGNGQEGFPH